MKIRLHTKSAFRVLPWFACLAFTATLAIAASARTVLVEAEQFGTAGARNTASTRARFTTALVWHGCTRDRHYPGHFSLTP